MADTNNTIESFFLNAVQRDFSRDILFRVNRIQFINGDLFGENDLLYAKSASLPARKIGNVEAKYAGLTFNLPGTVSFPGSDGYEIEFYCDQKSDLRNRFLYESERTFNHKSGIAGSGDPVNSGTIAEVRSQIVLQQLNKKLKNVCEYILVGCSIRDVGALDFQIAEGTGSIMSFKITVAYHYFDYLPVI